MLTEAAVNAGETMIAVEANGTLISGLATSTQAQAIKDDTERAFKDGDTIKVDVVQSNTDSEESLTALHTRVQGTQEPPVGE